MLANFDEIFFDGWRVGFSRKWLDFGDNSDHVIYGLGFRVTAALTEVCALWVLALLLSTVTATAYAPLLGSVWNCLFPDKDLGLLHPTANSNEQTNYMLQMSIQWVYFNPRPRHNLDLWPSVSKIIHTMLLQHHSCLPNLCHFYLRCS